MTDIKSEEKRENVRKAERWHCPRIKSSDPFDHERILLVSPFLPSPPESGAKQRTYFLWKALSEIAPVDVLLCTDPYKPIATMSSMPASMNLLGRFQWQPQGYRLHRLFEKSIFSSTMDLMLHVTIPKQWDYEVDHRLNRILSDILRRNHYFLAVGRYLKPMVKTGIVGQLPCLLDVDDIDFEILAQRAQDATRPRWRRFLNSAHSSQIKGAFQKWLPKFDGVWVTKTRDRRYPETRNAAILPNIPFHVPAFTPRSSGSTSANPVILTVGVLTYLPNRDGIDRFIREGWPKVRAACPSAEYWLAGRNDPGVAQRWQTVPGVRVLGYVDDLAALYEASWLSVCPLWTGAGTNIKVLESLAFERTCVSTVIGHRGFEDLLPSGDSLVVAVNAEKLAENCISLVHDHARRLALAKRGREVVQREFSYEKFASIVRGEVERVLGAKNLICN